MLEWLTKLKKNLLATFLSIAQDPDEQPDEEIQKTMSRNILAWEFLSLHKEGVTLPAHKCVHQPRSSLQSIVKGFYEGPT